MISAVVITYNEEENIRDCLESVKWADEIIVVDSESTDRTIEIAREYTDKVFVHPFTDYVSYKNLALSKCSCEWVLSIDADERVSVSLSNKIKEAVLQDTYNGYLIPRRTYYLGKWIKYSWSPDLNLRLIRRGKGRWVGKALHERLEVEGKIGKLNEPLLHYSYKSISLHIRRMEKYTTIAAEEMRKRGRRFKISDILIRPPWKFFRHYFIKLGFLDGIQGFTIALMAFWYTFLKYIKLYEMERKD